MRRSIIPIFIPHLGCAHRCVFCDQRAIAAQACPSPDEVVGIIARALGYADRPQISFYGGSFTAIPRALQRQYLAAASRFVEDGRCDSVRISTRPDCIDGDILDMLKAYGVKTIELGAQAMDDAVLAASGRGHSARDTERASALIKEAQMELILQVMAGLPGSGREQDLESAAKMAALKPCAARIYPVCVLKGTELAHMTERAEYAPLHLERAIDVCADMLEIFEDAHVPVIRIGLNPSEELSGGAVLAGAYHPAFGDLVRSRLLLRRVVKAVPQGPHGVIEITVRRGLLSRMRGQKNQNVQKLAALWPQSEIRIKEGEITAGDFVVFTANG